jgi:enamine deaminase RidA (YjgF/YER057c/UK114 family)
VTVERINPPDLAAPIGFSHAVRASGPAVYLAGQTALNADGVIVGTGIVEQFEVALGNLMTALRAAGGGGEHLAKVTIFSVDPVDYRAHARELGAVWRRLVGRDYPAMTLVGVTRLWDDTALVEIEGIAILP